MEVQSNAFFLKKAPLKLGQAAEELLFLRPRMTANVYDEKILDNGAQSKQAAKGGGMKGQSGTTATDIFRRGTMWSNPKPVDILPGQARAIAMRKTGALNAQGGAPPTSANPGLRPSQAPSTATGGGLAPPGKSPNVLVIPPGGAAPQKQVQIMVSPPPQILVSPPQDTDAVKINIPRE